MRAGAKIPRNYKLVAHPDDRTVVVATPRRLEWGERDVRNQYAKHVVGRRNDVLSRAQDLGTYLHKTRDIIAPRHLKRAGRRVYDLLAPRRHRLSPFSPRAERGAGAGRRQHRYSAWTSSSYARSRSAGVQSTRYWAKRSTTTSPSRSARSTTSSSRRIARCPTQSLAWAASWAWPATMWPCRSRD